MFSPLDFFPTIESRFFGGFRCSFYALAINDPSARFFVPTVFFLGWQTWLEGGVVIAIHALNLRKTGCKTWISG
jgi:hypothetical protein